MTKTERIINNLRIAIELAGDGGPSPFTSEEYEEMNTFLDSFKE